MRKYNRLIFVCTDNLCRSPMAEAVMRRINRTEGLEITSRGIIVLFPEPYNPKATAVLRNSGIILENGLSKQLTAEDFAEDTLVLTMDRTEKSKVLEEYENACNVYTIMEFAGGSGDIMDPYGGDRDVYALFLESINTWVTQVERKIYEISQEENDETEDVEQ